MLDADIAMINGGGIRADILQGPVTYNTLFSVFPFNNTACTATMTGAQLMEALEVTAMYAPLEDGSFMQVSGIRFKINSCIPSPVVMGEGKLYSHIGPGERRVSNVEVLDKASGKYLPVDLSRTYTIAGISYNMMKKVFKLQNDSFNITFEDVSCYATASTPLSDWSKTDKLRAFISEMFPGYDRAICMDGNTVFDGDASRGFVPVSLGGKGIPA